MGRPVWKIINVVGPRVVNGLNVAGYGWSRPEKSWTVPSLIQILFSNRNRIRIKISETLFSIYREFKLLEKV